MRKILLALTAILLFLVVAGLGDEKNTRFRREVSNHDFRVLEHNFDRLSIRVDYLEKKEKTTSEKLS